jgi:hypothetical protein
MNRFSRHLKAALIEGRSFVPLLFVVFSCHAFGVIASCYSLFFGDAASFAGCFFVVLGMLLCCFFPFRLCLLSVFSCLCFVFFYSCLILLFVRLSAFFYL